VARREYYHDDTAPPANSMTPTAFAAVRHDHGRILLVRRGDNGNWELPGGRVELGETATAAAEREVAEESGVTIKVTRLAGVYTDPGHVLVYPDTGEARQQFAVCFHALPVDGEPHPDHGEICEAAWINPTSVDHCPYTPACASGSARPSPNLTPHTSADHPNCPDMWSVRPGPETALLKE
jgi:ADP-ribose pyrophosphatase YjhB (NUDIX family)